MYVKNKNNACLCADGMKSDLMTTLPIDSLLYPSFCQLEVLSSKYLLGNTIVREILFFSVSASGLMVKLKSQRLKGLSSKCMCNKNTIWIMRMNDHGWCEESQGWS